MERHVQGCRHLAETWDPFAKSRTGYQRRWMKAGILAESFDPSASSKPDDDVARAGGENPAKRRPLAEAVLLDHKRVRTQLSCKFGRAVGGAAVDDDDLGDLGRDQGEDVREVRRLVHRRDDHVDTDPVPGREPAFGSSLLSAPARRGPRAPVEFRTKLRVRRRTREHLLPPKRDLNLESLSGRVRPNAIGIPVEKNDPKV